MLVFFTWDNCKCELDKVKSGLARTSPWPWLLWPAHQVDMGCGGLGALPPTESFQFVIQQRTFCKQFLSPINNFKRSLVSSGSDRWKRDSLANFLQQIWVSQSQYSGIIQAETEGRNERKREINGSHHSRNFVGRVVVKSQAYETIGH